MMLLTQDHLEQIYSALKNQYAYHESKLIVCFYDSHCFFLLYCVQKG